jgi:hypothetical protein
MSSPSLVSVACLLRGLPLFFAAAPRTPLRVLGIIALNTIHLLRHSRPLTGSRIRELAMFLDLEGCANADWDRKDLCAAEYQALRHRLEMAGLGLCIEEYLGRLRDLESHRPSIAGGQRFDDAREYREGVARLSIATAAAIALNVESLDDAIQSTARDPDVGTLFRILMQCQIIDDVMDYKEDVEAGLPSFLTASASLSEAITLTAEAARSYAISDRRAVLPLRIALSIVSAVTTLVLDKVKVGK